MRKVFNKDHYNLSDAVGKEAFRSIVEPYKHKVVENEGTEIDLTVTKPDGSVYQVEVEVKRDSWKQKEFMYSEVNIPERKRKYFELDGKVLYAMFNHNQETCMIFSGKEILEKARVAIVPNRAVPKGEKFFKIRKDFAATLYKDKNGLWNWDDTVYLKSLFINS